MSDSNTLSPSNAGYTAEDYTEYTRALAKIERDLYGPVRPGVDPDYLASEAVAWLSREHSGRHLALMRLHPSSEVQFQLRLLRRINLARLPLADRRRVEQNIRKCEGQLRRAEAIATRPA